MPKPLVLIMSLFYLAAGINHFYNPDAYYKIIPSFFSSAVFINVTSGLAEIILALLLLLTKTRKLACFGIVSMLVAFIPAHVYMIRVGWCIQQYCLPQWLIWARLIILQPLLIWWAWIVRNK